MIRFRFSEDERRYLLLVSEAYRLIAASLPAPAVSRVMRNLGKAQDMLLLEGVRQGLAVAELSQLASSRQGPDVRLLKAFQAHATIYGSQDTPLRAVELEWLEKLSINPEMAEAAWLDNNPMRFAPQTLKAYEAEQAALPRADSSIEARTPYLDSAAPLDQPTWPSKDDAVDTPASTYQQFTDATDEDDTQERPALLDQARDALQKLVEQGYQPRNWSEMIMRLHLILRVDAGFLDLQMATEMGRTVLAQCGIHDILPGRGINLTEMKKTLGDPEAVLSDGSTKP